MRAEPKRTGGLLRRFGVFVLGAVLGAALLWCSAFAGITLGFSGAGGGALSVLLLFAIVVATVALGGFLARLLLYGGPSERSLRVGGLFIGGSFFAGAFVSGVFLGVMILLDATPSQRTLFLFIAGPGLGLMYGIVLGMPAVVGAALAETRFYAQRGGGPTG
jgi:hypothetical protein